MEDPFLTQPARRSWSWPTKGQDLVTFPEFFKCPMDASPKFLEGDKINNNNILQKLTFHPDVQVLRDWVHQAKGNWRIQAPCGDSRSCQQDLRLQERVSEHLCLGDPGQTPV